MSTHAKRAVGERKPPKRRRRGQPPRPTYQQARELLWPWIDRNFPEAWDEPNSPILLSEELIRQANAFLRENRFLAKDHMIISWLTRPNKFDPFIDQTAVDRAVNLDYRAFENLSDLEKNAALDKMSKMTLFTGRIAGHNPDDPKRAALWEDLTDKERATLATLVSKRRQRANGVNTGGSGHHYEKKDKS